MSVIRTRWEPVPGFDNMYWVSNYGEVKSYRYWKPRGVASKGKAFPVKLKASADGYLYASFFKNGKSYSVSVGKLVLTIFQGPPSDERIWACHNDGDPSNNYIGNLRWGTNSENQMDRVGHGTSNRGAANGRSKFCEEDIHRIRHRLKAGHSQTDIALDYGVAPSAICNIKRKRNWGHLPERD